MYRNERGKWSNNIRYINNKNFKVHSSKVSKGVYIVDTWQSMWDRMNFSVTTRIGQEADGAVIAPLRSVTDTSIPLFSFVLQWFNLFLYKFLNYIRGHMFPGSYI